MLRVVIMVAALLCLPAGCKSQNAALDSTPVAAPGLAANAATLTPFAVSSADGDRYGYRDSAARVVIEPRFLMADDFSESGLAAVVDESGWAYIDSSGRVLLRPLVVDNGPDPFSEGLARFEQEGRIGFFDERGKVVIEARFDFAFSFSEGFAAACNGCARKKGDEHSLVSGGKWGYIDPTGQQVIPFVFDEAGSFEGGRASVVEAGKSKSIGKNGGAVP